MILFVVLTKYILLAQPNFGQGWRSSYSKILYDIEHIDLCGPLRRYPNLNPFIIIRHNPYYIFHSNFDANL